MQLKTLVVDDESFNLLAFS